MLNTLLHLLVYQVLVALGVYYLVSSVIGYGVGLTNSYVLNRTFTFRATVSRRWVPEFLRFGLVNVVSLGVNVLVLYAVVASGLLDKRLGIFVAIAASLSVNFLGNKLWTFHPRRS